MADRSRLSESSPPPPVTSEKSQNTDDVLPSAKSVSVPGEHDQLRRIVVERHLCGLANDTKWDEFINAIRGRKGWTPAFRYKCIDGLPSRWEEEWCYHLPSPMRSVEWLDMTYRQEVRDQRMPPQISIIDHSTWLVPLLRDVGLDFQIGTAMIRVFGYAPRSDELFDQQVSPR